MASSPFMAHYKVWNL